jgi:hypothetical protein
MRDIVSPISGFSSPIGQKRFSVRDLFRRDEPGVWYDPSDLSTMFQDLAGTTPVTAPGQTVRLVLDKSRGLALGGEVWTNSGVIGMAATIAANGAGWNVTATGTSFVGIRLNTASLGTSSYRAIVSWSGNVNGRSIAVLVGGGVVTLGTTASGSATVVVASSGASNSIQMYAATATVGETFTFTVSSVRELPGAHLVANSDAARGLYQVDETGRPYILFDGADDGYVTPTITPGTDKVQLWAGIRKNSDAARGTVAELSTTIASNNGALQLTAPNAASATYAFESKGTTLTDAVATPFAAPLTSVVTGLGDIAGDSAIIRVNGVEADADTGDQGTGNYLAAPLYVGRRGAASQSFNGRLYQLAVRFGPNLDTSRIEQVERYMAQKTGVTL